MTTEEMTEMGKKLSLKQLAYCRATQALATQAFQMTKEEFHECVAWMTEATDPQHHVEDTNPDEQAFSG